MNKRPNPFQQAYHPQAPAFTPGQPPLPPGPPPSLAAPQYDYSAYWAAAAASGTQAQPQAAPTPGTYPQWPQQPPQPPPPQPTPEQTALYANYGYGGAGPAASLNWAQNRAPAPPPAAIAPAAPQYNPYQPQQPAYAPAPLPQQFGPPQYGAHMPPTPFYKPPQQLPQPQPQLQHSPPNPLPPAKRPRFEGPPAQPRFQPQPQLQMGPHQPNNNRAQLGATPMAPANFMNHTSIRGGGVMLSNNRGGNRGGRGGNMRGRVGMGRGNANVAPIRGPIPTQPRGGAPRGPAAFNRRGGYPMNTPSGPRPKNLPNTTHTRQHTVGVNEITRPDGTVRAWGAGSKVDKENAEGKRTLTDFRLIGFDVHGDGLSWSWGVTRPPKASQPDGFVKKEEVDAESFRSTEATDTSAEGASSATGAAGKESSRIRIYFHTPSHAALPRTNGKRKKPEVDEDEVDAETERLPPAAPLPAVPVSVTRSMSVDIPPSVSGTDGDEDGDWLMDAIGHDIDDPGEDSEVGQSGSVRSSVQPSDSTLKQSPPSLVREDSLFGSVSGGSVLGLNGPDQTSDLQFDDDDDTPDRSHTPLSESSPVVLPVAPPLSSLPSDETVAHVAKAEETEAHHSPLPSSAQVTSSEAGIPHDDASVIDEKPTPAPSELVLPPTSPVTPHQPSKDNTAQPVREVAGNRLSISYALSAMRLVIDASVVENVKIFRSEGRIEVKAKLEPSPADEGIKGVLLEALSETTQQYEAVPLPSPTSPPQSPSPDSKSDPTSGTSIHPPLGVDGPQVVTFQIYLDLDNPLSVPKWVKTGDVEEWLRSMFGNGPFLHGKGKGALRDEDRGWVGKITVVDPDPPPTLASIIETWGNNSLVGQAKERRWFLRNHLADVDNVLEILLRLVRGERATASAPLSQNSPAGSLSGPLLTALSPTSSHAAQQTHVSLAVMALFRMGMDLAERAGGDNEEKVKENRKYVEETAKEIIRCIPQHLIYKSLDGMFREWTADKKNHKSVSS